MLTNEQVQEFQRIGRTHCGSVGRRAIERLVFELERAQGLLDEARIKLRDKELLDRVDEFFTRH